MTERYWVRRALKNASDDHHAKLEAENERLVAVLKGIAEYCSGDGAPLGAIARLAAIRNTAEQALRVHGQAATDSNEKARPAEAGRTVGD